MSYLRYLILTSTCMFSAASVIAAEDALENYQFKGVHFMASYLGCDHEKLTNGHVQELMETMLHAVSDSGATILDSCHYVFSPEGLTMVVLLSESHASIHTYPEHNACFVDLFTCGQKCSAKKFDEKLREYLQPTEVNEKTLIRHEGFETP